MKTKISKNNIYACNLFFKYNIYHEFSMYRNGAFNDFNFTRRCMK